MDFENRRAATLQVVSTGSAESRYLQPSVGQMTTHSKKAPAPGAWNGGLDRALEALCDGSGVPGNRGEIPVSSLAVEFFLGSGI